MIIGHIAGFVFLPVSIILLLNAFSVTNVQSLAGMPVLLLASIGLILVQMGDIIDAHIKDSFKIVAWIVCLILMFPAFLYFMRAALPEQVVNALPIITGSFLFVEGLSSFFIGGH
ncbi:hypothetical protein COY28_06815 [Candidatus Woesearchaeota archaeon CG_4_10_14_0_2_um_filter_57_5]|nr:MAG: hypothetical protein AUJ68_01950 [Candidatus Woesearchaeota archaeon CG1_02_57_44]PIN70123.1 MAG: hypothetical protein COV94_02050 [Candidatus Woesearchaeota archaeon CG11_big_fil_rev_8_21_14_0_20_57_5]PIZ48888.1 MAG: hypothetical protein COY28_06815 [Candidatus Woesearchaeota archaeon CG_4_10_14_0_2_um_filter_57_5]